MHGNAALPVQTKVNHQVLGGRLPAFPATPCQIDHQVMERPGLGFCAPGVIISAAAAIVLMGAAESRWTCEGRPYKTPCHACKLCGSLRFRVFGCSAAKRGSILLSISCVTLTEAPRRRGCVSSTRAPKVAWGTKKSPCIYSKVAFAVHVTLKGTSGQPNYVSNCGWHVFAAGVAGSMAPQAKKRPPVCPLKSKSQCGAPGFLVQPPRWWSHAAHTIPCSQVAVRSLPECSTPGKVSSR